MRKLPPLIPATNAAPPLQETGWRKFFSVAVHILRLVVPLMLITLVLLALSRLLHDYTYDDLVNELQATSRNALTCAFILCALNYFILTLYDLLALQFLSRPLPYKKVAFASFVSFALSQNVGFALLSGGAVRFRLYGRWGLSFGEISKVLIFCGFHFWAGFLALGSLSALLFPDQFAFVVGADSVTVRLFGVVLVSLVATYLFLCPRASATKSTVTLPFVNYEVELPRRTIAAKALLVSSFDWLLSAGVLFVLLPSAEMSYVPVLVAFLGSQFLGVVSHVPGGLGVFETVMVYALSPYHRQTSILGALILFRLIYYIIPFGVSLLLLGLYEVRRAVLNHRVVIAKWIKIGQEDSSLGRFVDGVLGASELGRRGFASLVRPFISSSVFAAGAVLLFSGASPTALNRIWWVDDVVPLSLLEVSHFVSSIIGVVLLILAWGLWRRLHAAFVLTSLLLFAGMFTSLIKGFDYEEALFLALTLFILRCGRASFYRLSGSLFTPNPKQLTAIAAVIGASLWLGFFSYRHVEYGPQLWWIVEEEGDAPRFLRASLAVGVLLLVYGLYSFLRTGRISKTFAPVDIATVKPIVRLSSATESNLALLGDKQIFFNEQHDGFIMYRVVGRSWIAMGDPVCARPEGREELAWIFREEADAHDGIAVFYEVSARNLPLYLELGLRPLKIGEEAKVRLHNFSLEGGDAKGFRQILRRFEKEQYEFSVCSEQEVPALLPELREISDLWLDEKHTREKGFSLGFFSEEYLAHFPLALVKKGGKLFAFSNIWSTADKSEISVDLMRHRAETPNGIMDFLFLNLLKWSKEQGYESFTLGMAPFSGFETRPLAPLWNRLGAYLYKHGEHFYNFEGLRRYKDKFKPEWEPRYLVSPGGILLPIVLANVASAISRGLTGVIRK